MAAGLSQAKDTSKQKEAVSQDLPAEKERRNPQIIRDPDYAGPANIAGVITDDEFVIRRLQSKIEIPFNRYTSLSVLLKAAEVDEDAPLEDQLMVVRKSDINPMQMTTLQPLHHSIPYYISVAKRKKTQASKKSEVEIDKIPSRVPPATLADAFREQYLLGGSSHQSTAPEFPVPGQKWSPRHYGVEWPVRYASKPPYTSPGYDCTGIKQPVGVIPLDPVPSYPDYAIVGTRRMQVPAWVSPLYKPYGIGGHVGLEIPFSKPVPVAHPQILINKPTGGFFQRLKDLFKSDNKTEGPKRFAVFKLRPRSRAVKKTADLPRASLTDILNAESTNKKPDKTNQPVTTNPEYAPYEDEMITKPADEEAQPERSSIFEQPRETERSSVSEPHGETEPSGVSDRLSVTQGPSDNEGPAETDRASVSEGTADTERASVSTEPFIPESPYVYST